MRFLHTGDWHVGKTLRGKSRAEEHREVLAEIAELARARKVDIVLVAGDLFDGAAPGPEAEEIVYRALLDLSRASEWVVVISGNHDNPRRLEAVEPLMRLTNIRVLAKPARPAEGGVLALQTKVGGASIALLPFLSQRNIVKADDLMASEAAQHQGAYAERATRVIAELCALPPPPKTVNILLAHAMVHGGVLGGGERQAHTIFEYSVPATAFPGSLHYAALGHLHRSQRLPAACPAWYSGSPLQLDFGETEDVKSVNLIEAEPDTPAEVEVVPLRAGRCLRRLRGTLGDIERLASEAGDAYLRVELSAAPAPGLADKVREILPNAVDVVIAGQRTAVRPDKAPRIGRSPRELFAEYLEEKSASDPRVRALFDEIFDQLHAPD
ncbi:MAG TPA: exonuclease SbcCD subunit D [Vicinamibacteria bacterium]|nr:exonuclease SbcCD subunit D [Vicinamibacteria bacterium]